MIAFKNSNIYVNGEKIKKSSLVIEDEDFSSFNSIENAIELDDKYFIVPGFIEEHIHGVKGTDSMDPDDKSISNIATSLLEDGTTSFLATTMTMSKKDIIAALKNISSHKLKDHEAKILGVHLEGPFISKAYKGAQDDSYILKPNVEDMKEFMKASNNSIKLITVAIEEANDAFLEYLKDNGVVVSLGHTNTPYKAVEEAINKKYLSCTTHTYNAMSKLHHRDIGAVGAALLHDELYSELILDYNHVSKAAAKLLFKNKGKDKLVLITDSMEARGMSDGTYKLGTYPVYKKGSLALLEDGTLAGSVLRMNEALKHAEETFSLTMEETIDLATKNVCNNLHLNNIGQIKIGNKADFVIIDKDYNVYQTYVNGKLAYSKPDFKF